MLFDPQYIITYNSKTKFTFNEVLWLQQVDFCTKCTTKKKKISFEFLKTYTAIIASIQQLVHLGKSTEGSCTSHKSIFKSKKATCPQINTLKQIQMQWCTVTMYCNGSECIVSHVFKNCVSRTESKYILVVCI